MSNTDFVVATQPAHAEPARKTPPKKATFDAFKVSKEVILRGGRKVQKVELIAPETGIHSAAWALNIVAQPQSILTRFPLEIRTQIFTLIIAIEEDEDYGLRNFWPKFNHENRLFGHAVRGHQVWRGENPTVRCMDLALICRQTYLEVIGNSLIYRLADFHFKNHMAMSSYLDHINPRHKFSITSISFGINLTAKTPNVSKKILLKLAALQPSLQHLKIDLDLSKELCYFTHEGTSSHLPFYRNELKESTFNELSSTESWKVIKGLKSFDMDFLGPYDHPWVNWRKIESRYMGASDKVQEVKKKIREIVMRKE